MHKCYAFDNIYVWTKRTDFFRSPRANKVTLQADKRKSAAFPVQIFTVKYDQGNGIRSSFGVFIGLQIIHLPLTPELALWTLWSADKQGNPQGIWSHETALDIHELSDVAPAKLHMSVPRSFRKGTEIPNNLCLHFVDEIPQSDIENTARISRYHAASNIS